jgi:hypothetical protein
MKSHIYAFLCLFLALACPVFAQDATATKVKKLPFHGKLEAVDTAAQTITLSGKSARVFHLTAETKITDGAGAPSTLAAATVGEDVGGSYTKDAAGTMTLYSVRFGAKDGSKTATTTAAKTASAAAAAPAAAPAPAPAAPAAASAPAAATAPAATTAAAAKVKKQSFSGTVVSVATDSLVIHGKADQTFTVTPTTKITDATGTATTLSAITAGSKVTGSYSKSTDGTVLTVYTLKIKK